VNQRLKAVVFLTMVNALWGMSFPIVKSLNLQLDHHFQVVDETASLVFRVASATWIIGLRFGFAFALLLIFFRKLVFQALPREWAAGALIGTFFLLGLILQTIGLATIPASRSGFLTSLSVVFTPLVIAIGHGKRPSNGVFSGIALAVLGVSILTGLVLFDDAGLRMAPDAMKVWTKGDTLTTIASFFFSMQIICIDRFGKQMNPVALTPGMFVAAAGFATFVFLAVSQMPNAPKTIDFVVVSQQLSFWPLILVLSVFPSLVAFSWMNTYQPLVTAVQAAVIYTMEPVFVSLWAFFLPGILSAICALTYANETLTIPILLGGGLILIANVLALWPSPKEIETQASLSE